MRISQAERSEKREGCYAGIVSPAETSSLFANAKNLYCELELGLSVHCHAAVGSGRGLSSAMAMFLRSKGLGKGKGNSGFRWVE